MTGIDPALLPKVVLYPCCKCCVVAHSMSHADPCLQHQRSLIPKRTRRTKTIETTEAL